LSAVGEQSYGSEGHEIGGIEGMAFNNIRLGFHALSLLGPGMTVVLAGVMPGVIALNPSRLWVPDEGVAVPLDGTLGL